MTILEKPMVASDLMVDDIIKLKDGTEWSVEEICGNVLRVSGDGLEDKRCVISIRQSEVWLMKNYDGTYTCVLQKFRPKQQKGGAA